jgi:hypothetical protein
MRRKSQAQRCVAAARRYFGAPDRWAPAQVIATVLFTVASCFALRQVWHSAPRLVVLVCGLFIGALLADLVIDRVADKFDDERNDGRLGRHRR